MIWHTSDWHFDHKNIIDFDKRPDENVVAMNNRIIDSMNQHVTEKDWLVYHGDIMLNKEIDRDDAKAYVQRIRFFLVQLRCQNIIFICGNHDITHVRVHGEHLPNWPFWNLFQTRMQCADCGTVWAKYEHENNSFNAHKRCKCGYDAVQMPIYDIHPMGYELRITKKICAEHSIPIAYEGMLIVCTHYAHRVWNKSHHQKNEHLGRALNLYGHSHGSLPGIKNSFDVGFNVWNRPLSLVEIMTKLMPEHNQTENGQVYFGHHQQQG